MAQYLEHAKRRLDVKHVVGIKEGYLLFEYMWSIYLSIGISTKWENSKTYFLVCNKIDPSLNCVLEVIFTFLKGLKLT